MKDLAIIIPAYKPDFIEETLVSFSKQTNKNFTIYIGDDYSPYDIKSVIDKFSDDLEIHYHRFDENLGAKSLTKQWERCIALSSEDWIWLFSDDDIVSETCVETFFDRRDKQSNFFKFNTKVIDNDGNLIMKKYDKKNILSKDISAIEFINKRLNVENFRSFAVEYIFHRKLYDAYKFVDFPLAWASDDATWFLYGIKNQNKIGILNDIVFWRHSGRNISSSVKNDEINQKKVDASVKYLVWLKGILFVNGMVISDTKKLKWLSIQIASLKYKLSYKAFKAIIEEIKLKVSKMEILKNYLIIKYYHLRNRLN